VKIQVITLFPEEFTPLVDLGVTGRGIREGKVQLELLNPRDFARNRHRTVDDALVSLLSPQGRQLDQAAVRHMAQREHLILVCGRYEGIDERLIELEVDEEWSVGDYVLSGGELAAAVIIDAVTRLVPGVLGDEQSAQQDSFTDGLLDCQHYTRPEEVDGLEVPPVLLSGDHAAIRRWRKKQSLGRTWLRRPDLLSGLELDTESRALLAEFRHEVAEQDGRQ